MKTVLVVDDSKTAQMMNSMLLRKFNYRILTAQDGVEGVHVAKAEKPDLILMDVMMPRMNGFEAMRTLRGAEETRSIPIIMVTTKGEESFMEEGWSTGCNDYVTKPVNGPELMQKVQAILG
jgi:CheY-like chemotaxis protein